MENYRVTPDVVLDRASRRRGEIEAYVFTVSEKVQKRSKKRIF
jgi:hypothetical protein